jgi:hypothetical protein
MPCGLLRPAVATILFAWALANSGQEPAPPQKLTDAAKQMDQYLQSLEQHSQAEWKKYFDWESWGPPLIQEQLPPADHLQTILPRFYGFRKGLDNAAFLRARAELKRYLDGSDIPTIIGKKPSLYIRMDKAVVNDSLAKRARLRDDHSYSQNHIAGAWVTGPTHSHTEVKAQLVPLQERAAIEVRLRGTVSSPQNVAQKGRFRVYGSSVSYADGVAYLILENGAFHATPPQVTVRTENQFSGFSAPPLLRRVARRQACKREPQGEAEGSEIVRREVIKEFSKELAEEVAEVNAKLDKYDTYMALLKAIDIAPSKIDTALVQDTLQLGLNFGDSGAEAAPAPRALVKESPLEISMHQSFLTAFPRKFMKGAWWSEVEFDQLRKALAPLRENETLTAGALDNESWGARWDWVDPVSIEIRDGVVECKLAFSNARIKDQWVKAGLLLTAKFQPEASPGKIGFRRVGEVRIEAKKPNTELTAEEEAFFKRQFSVVCGDFIPLNNLNPAAGIAATAVSLFSTASMSIEDQWLNVSYRKLENPVTKLVGK